MEDIFHWCREGNTLQVRVWLDDTENDMNQGDDHGFSPLHWACKEGHYKLVDLLLSRGARINATNRGDDTPLHLAAAHGHREIVNLLLRNRADINFTNEHGNTPLHYACFWGYQQVAEDLIAHGAIASLANKDGDTPLDKARGSLAKRFHELAVETGQDLKKINFRDQSWLGLKTRSRKYELEDRFPKSVLQLPFRWFFKPTDFGDLLSILGDATLSRHKGINLSDLSLHTKLGSSHNGETWRGRWQKNDIVAKILNVRDCTSRISRDFNEEYPKLRIFSHPNILPVIGCCNSPPNLIVINQYMPWGSLYQLLHEGSGVVVEAGHTLRFAVDIARGMAYLHSLERIVPQYQLNSRHVMIDEDLTARINMADAKFSFQEKGRIYSPAWMSPEALQKKPSDRNLESCDMWSFAILLWELATREVPLSEFSAMEIGLKVVNEGLRVVIPHNVSAHMSKLIKICMNEEPGKRPTFEMVLPILEKMKK